MTDLVKRAAECECPPNMGCNVPSDHCRCELIEDMVNRIETLEAALRAAYDDCLDAVNKNKTDFFTQLGAFRKIEYSTSTAKDFMVAMAEDIECEIKARAVLAGEKKE